jgi:hypothetical protein
VVLPQSTAWSTCNPWDSHAILRSFGATAHSSSINSSNSTVALLPLHSNRWQLGHHNTPVGYLCYNSMKVGHFNKDCCQPRQGNLSRTPALALNQQGSQHRGPAPRSAHANYTTMEEIPTGEEVLTGTFFLNERPIIILFDSRASYNFVSST